VVSEALDPVRKRHHVTVADSPDLHDLHSGSIHAYILIVKAPTELDGGGSLEGDGWVNWSGLATLLSEVASAFTYALGRLAWR
jgi:hypothetical protein